MKCFYTYEETPRKTHKRDEYQIIIYMRYINFISWIFYVTLLEFIIIFSSMALSNVRMTNANVFLSSSKPLTAP